MPSAALTLPSWFQWVLGVIAILSFLGGAWFALFVVWPGIRKSNLVADKILSSNELSGMPVSKDGFAAKGSRADQL